MKRLRLSLYALSMLFIVSCSKTGIVNPNCDEVSDLSIEEDEILFEPPSSNALDKEENNYLKSLPTGDIADWLVDENELKGLGRSYWFNGEELIDDELKDPVINIRTLIEDKQLDGSIIVSSQRKVEIQTQAFRDYQHTWTENRRFNKVDGGFKFDLFGLVKLFDFTSSYEKTFYNQKKDFNTALFGEANVYVYGKDVSLSNSIGTRAGIIERHLYPNFIRTLYNSPMGRVSLSIGPFILSKYRLGGKLSAKYLYRKKEQESLDSIYSKFKTGLDLTFKVPDGISPSAGVHYNRNNFKSFKTEEEKQQLYVSFNTIGGAPEFQISISPRKQDDFNDPIDISTWLSSLSNMKTHTIVDIQDNGLVPISDFILESNFGRRLMDIYKGVLEINMQNQTPQVEVTKVFVRHNQSGEILCDIAIVLSTRNGDKLRLTKLNEKASDEELLLNNRRDIFIQKGQKFATSVSPIFKGLKISGKPNKILYPYLRTTLCSDAVIDFTRLKKYKNPITKVVFLYDDVTKVALSYYQGEKGDMNLEKEYGLTDFVQTLPEQEISIINLLQNYRVLGL